MSWAADIQLSSPKVVHRRPPAILYAIRERGPLFSTNPYGKTTGELLLPLPLPLLLILLFNPRGAGRPPPGKALELPVDSGRFNGPRDLGVSI